MKMVESICVNALKGATFISTRDDKYTTKPDPECVNALKGATFISTVTEDDIKKLMNHECQCPKRGNLHFYSYLRKPA